VEIDRRNFSRKILDAEYIINSGKKREGLKNRHPELFHFNKNLKKNNFQLNIHIQ
jgi:8-oxo-dGTP diphosphatase